MVIWVHVLAAQDLDVEGGEQVGRASVNFIAPQQTPWVQPIRS
jgi:hypothetical protein